MKTHRGKGFEPHAFKLADEPGWVADFRLIDHAGSETIVTSYWLKGKFDAEDLALRAACDAATREIDVKLDGSLI